MTGINPAAASDFGKNSGIAFRYKLQIGLAPGEPIDESTKWLKLNNNIVTGTSAASGIEYSGSLTFA